MRSMGLLFTATLLAVGLMAPPLLAAQEGIRVDQAWARASAGAATTGAAYVTLIGGTQADQMTGASSPVSAGASVHTTADDNGVMRMRPVPLVPIPAGQKVTFKPGGLHIMLEGLKHPLTAGQSFPLTLTFAHAAPVTVDVPVRALGRDMPTADHDHMHMR